jgi:hypothetical protein
MAFETDNLETITKKQDLRDFHIGSHISYINVHDVFKLGGQLLKIKPDYFIYLSENDQKIRVRFVNVDKMWVGFPYRKDEETGEIINDGLQVYRM